MCLSEDHSATSQVGWEERRVQTIDRCSRFDFDYCETGSSHSRARQSRGTIIFEIAYHYR